MRYEKKILGLKADLMLKNEKVVRSEIRNKNLRSKCNIELSGTEVKEE